MRKTLISSLAGAIAVVGLVATTLGSPATAEPGSATAHLGDILAGPLSDWDGPSGWAEENADAIADQGFDAAAAGREATAAQAAALTVDVAQGTIAVAGACTTETKVGYALGSVTGKLNLTVLASLSLSEGSDAMDFTDEEAVGLVPPLEITIKDPDGTGVYELDLTEGTLTGAPGNAALDAKLAGHEEEIVDTVASDMGELIAEGLNEGLPTALEDIIWEIKFDRDLGYSFGYPFGPAEADQLVNGRTATVDLTKVTAGTWVAELAGKSKLATMPIADLHWSDFVPESAADAIALSPTEEYFDELDLTEIASDQMITALGSQLGFIVTKAAEQLQNGINDGISQISNQPLLDEYPDSTIEITPIDLAGRKAIENRLKELTADKVDTQWRDGIVEDGLIEASVTRTLTGVTLSQLIPTGVTQTPVGATLTVAGLSLEAGQTGTLRPTAAPVTGGALPAGSPTYTFQSSNASVATVDGSGLVTAVGDGSADITVTATWTCAAGTPVSAQTTATVTVEDKEPTYCDTLPAIQAELAALATKYKNEEISTIQYFQQVTATWKKLQNDQTPADAKAPLASLLAYFDEVNLALEDLDMDKLKELMGDAKQAEVNGWMSGYQKAVEAACPALKKPTITTPAEGAVLKDNKPVVGGTSQANAQVRVDARDGAVCSTTANASGQWACTITKAIPDGPAIIEAYEFDANGNTSDKATVNVTVNTAASPSPTPTSASPSPTTTTKSPSPTVTTSSPSPTKTTTSPSPTKTTSSPSPTKTTTSPSPTKTTTSPSPTKTTSSPSPTTTTSSPSPTQTTTPTTASPTPTATPTATPSATPTPTATPSATPTPGLTATVSQSGSTITFTGTGFKAGETVAGTVNSTPISLGTKTADSSGKVTFTWTVPSTFTAGTHTITLTGPQSGSVVQSFTYGVPLPNTGAAAATLDVGLGGLMALGLGALCLVVAYLRRDGSHQV
jgi:hypothetical protein